MTDIQDGDLKAQIVNFTEKISEYSNKPIFTVPKNWQEASLNLKGYLKTLSNNKKHVIFLDELPWINTSKSGFIQLLNTKKNIFTTLISNHPIKENEHSLEFVDIRIIVSDLM